jgi:hypothetical protein
MAADQSTELFNVLKYPQEKLFPMKVHAADQTNIPPIDMPDRFRHDIAYFITPSGEGDIPELPDGDFWISTDDARRWLDDLVFEIMSPLDSQNVAEVEITDEQEAFFEWLLQHKVNHVRLG